MTNIFIIHGTYGNPEENWFPWLKSELEKLDCRVFVPKFPTPENQSLENFQKVNDLMARFGLPLRWLCKTPAC